jgi:hypothetical protein
MSAYQNSDYNNNYNSLQKSLSTVTNDYGFSYFIPASNNVSDISKCYTPHYSNVNLTKKKINSKDISEYQGTNKVYHTNDSCKINASILQSKSRMNDMKTMTDKPIDKALT